MVQKWIKWDSILTLMLIFWTILFTGFLTAVMEVSVYTSLIAIGLAALATGKIYGFVYGTGIEPRKRLRVALLFVFIQIAIAIIISPTSFLTLMALMGIALSLIHIAEIYFIMEFGAQAVSRLIPHKKKKVSSKKPKRRRK